MTKYAAMSGLLPIEPTASQDEVRAAVRQWVTEYVPSAWRDAAARGGAAEIRTVRTRAEYLEWYPVYGASGLVVPSWPREYCGLGLPNRMVRVIEDELRPYNLGRLNALGLNLAAPALFAHGSEEQRLRFLPPIVRNEEKWCQMFSEPGAGSDLASLATRATRDGDEWVLTGQKVWTTWALESDYGVILARTDADTPKRQGITYFLLHLHQPGVEIRPLKQMTGDMGEFNEVFLEGALVPDSQRVGAIGDGWKVANATLSGERQMVSGSGSGGVGRIGGGGIAAAIRAARENGAWADAIVRQRLMRLYSEDRIRDLTNQRVRATMRAGRSPGAESSIGKVHQGSLNQALQEAIVDLLGPGAMAWPETDDGELPYAVHGFLRSRANTIEGGTTEVNKNILGERVLGLPREPDPWHDRPWREVPRS
ncbi:MAG: acyl-CoA dehydrogenase family protein [Acidimicrobiales bacterium]